MQSSPDTRAEATRGREKLAESHVVSVTLAREGARHGERPTRRPRHVLQGCARASCGCRARPRAPQDRDGEVAHLREQLEEYQVAQPALAGGGGGGGGSDDGGALALLERPAAGDRWAGGGSRARELHSHPILCAAAAFRALARRVNGPCRAGAT